MASADGRDLVWIADLAGLPESARAMIDEDLARRECMPTIEAILDVSSYATPSTWTVATDRDETRFRLKGEESIRRLPGGMLLIAGSHGVQYLIRDPARLDRASRRLLDRFRQGSGSRRPAFFDFLSRS